MYKILFFALFTLTTLSLPAYAEDNKDIQLINQFGNEIDTCRTKYYIHCDSAKIGGVKCFYEETAMLDKLLKCYQETAKKIFHTYYPTNEKESLLLFEQYIKQSSKSNAAVYFNPEFCITNCGLSPTLLAQKATIYDTQEYLLRILDYLYSHHKN